MRPLPFAADVRAVLFDAGNTLLWIDHARLATILGTHGVACDEAAVRRAEMRARPRLDPFLAAASRRESAEVFARYLALFAEELGAAVPDGARRDVVADWPSLWTRVPEGADAVLAALGARGLRLGVVSNSNGTVAASLERAGLARHFGCVMDSGVVGVEKPDPRIFRLAAEALGVAPAACVHVGDLAAVDVAGARAAGMHAVLLDPDGVWPPSDVPRVASLDELLARL